MHVANLSHSELCDEITEFMHFFQLSSQMLVDIEVHGFLLWSSMGFLMPVSILSIRMSNREECGRKFKFMFYMHATLQESRIFFCSSNFLIYLIIFYLWEITTEIRILDFYVNVLGSLTLSTLNINF